MAFQRSLETILRGHETQRLALESKVAELQESLLDESYAFEDKLGKLASSHVSAPSPDLTAFSRRLSDVAPLSVERSGVDSILQRTSAAMMSTPVSGVASPLLSQSLSAPLAHIRAAERRLERSMQRVQAGKPLWGSSAVRLGEEAALQRQHDAVKDFKRSFDTMHQTIAKQCVDARSVLVRDTKVRLEELVQRQLAQQLTECQRLGEEEIAPTMTHVAAECIQQLDVWVAKLRARCDDERSKAEAALRATFAVEAEKILVELAALNESDHKDKLARLAQDLQAQKNDALSAAAVELSRGLDDRIKSMKQAAVDELNAALQQLQEQLQRDQDDAAAKIRGSVDAEHAAALRQAKAALDAANAKALETLREKKKRELHDNMARLAQAATEASERDLRDALEALEHEMTLATQSAVDELQSRLDAERQSTLEMRSNVLLREREAALAEVRDAAIKDQRDAVADLQRQFEVDTVGELAKLKEQLAFEKESAMLRARKELEASKAARLVQMESEIVRAKDSARAAVLAECDKEAKESLAKLEGALLADRAKSEASLRAAKKAELQERLQRLEKELTDETELKLHEIMLQWSSSRRKAEDTLKSIVASADAAVEDGSDDENVPVDGGVPKDALAKLQAAGKSDPSVALAVASLNRWIATLNSQFREVHRSLKAAKQQVIKHARSTTGTQLHDVEGGTRRV